jgi:CubicO group peptidase (beta-lactamase class C family)
MKNKSLLLLGLSLCSLGSEAAIGQTVARSTPNVDPNRLRAIVQAGAQKAGTKAVEFGMWVHDREVLTMALGNSMTTVSATTDMHWRIGGIAETFMSTLLLMLVEQGHVSLDDRISRWFPDLLAADQVTVRMLVANTAGYIDYVTVDDFLKLELAEPFRTFVDQELINYSVRDGKMNFSPGAVANGWIVQNPSIDGYSGGFGYNLADGVTIVVGSTKSETAATDASALDILREVTQYVTPATPINF